MLICSIGFMLMWLIKYNNYSAKLTILKTLNADCKLCSSALDDIKIHFKNSNGAAIELFHLR